MAEETPESIAADFIQSPPNFIRRDLAARIRAYGDAREAATGREMRRLCDRAEAAEARARGDEALRIAREHLPPGRLRPEMGQDYQATIGALAQAIREYWVQQAESMVSLHQLELAEGRVERVRAIWPHIELAKDGQRYDPGPQVCLRCKIEEVING